MKKIELIKNIFLSNFAKLNSPYKVTFAATYRCNLKCKICKIWERPYREELGLEEIEKIFKGLKNLCWLDLTGGEITLREDFIEIVKAITKNAKKLSVLHISTNGQLPRNILLLAKEIQKLGIISIINVGIDGPKRINDRLRGTEGCYLKALETFKSLKRLGRNYCYLSCTISDHNVDYIDEFVSRLKECRYFSIADLHFNIYHVSSHYYKNHTGEVLKLKFNNIKKYLKLSERGNLVKKALEKKYIKSLSRYLNGDKFPIKCQALKSSCFINPYGEVYPCGMYDRFIGDLKNYDYNINEVWNSSGAFKVRKDIEERKCAGCWSPCEAYPAMLGNLFK